MTGDEHISEAERLLDEATEMDNPSGPPGQRVLLAIGHLAVVIARGAQRGAWAEHDLTEVVDGIDSIKTEVDSIETLLRVGTIRVKQVGS